MQMTDQFPLLAGILSNACQLHEIIKVIQLIRINTILHSVLYLTVQTSQIGFYLTADIWHCDIWQVLQFLPALLEQCINSCTGWLARISNDLNACNASMHAV